MFIIFSFGGRERERVEIDAAFTSREVQFDSLAAGWIFRGMTDAQTFSWIMLSVSYGGGTREEIAQIADEINHAVPTAKEINESLRWLQEQGLVSMVDGRFTLTETGEALLPKVPSQVLMKRWNGVSEAIENILETRGRNI